ncbi:WD repeat-containing protein 75-like [Oscarella lobularis]|uniref:WD repeat-containing protein 75-like n=1 Tax=Oscarella lobularis TaxID=121494 RepID=UPI003313BFA6
MSVVCGGYSLTKRKSGLFTLDSKRFVVCSEESIRIYSTTTGQCIRSLQSHRRAITSLGLGPVDDAFVSSSLDGTVLLWNHSADAPTKRIDVKVPVVFAHFSTDIAKAQSKLLYVREASSNGENGDDHRHHRDRRLLYEIAWTDEIEAMTSVDAVRTSRFVAEFRPVSRLFCANAHYVAAACRDHLQIVVVDGGDVFDYRHTAKITCLAVHDADALVAVGEPCGAITLWYEICRHSVPVPVKVRLHWHAHAPLALAFSSDGTYLYSGGEEAVLVVWQIATGSTRFVPRLGAPLQHVVSSDDGARVGVYHADNRISLLSGHALDVEKVIGGFTSTTEVSTGLVELPGRSNFVLNGSPGQLQFYDPVADEYVGSVDVTGQNIVSRREEKPLAYVRVTRVAFSSNAEWMTTIEEGGGGLTGSAHVTMKFWQSRQRALPDTYAVNTCVEMPHSGAVTDLRYRPSVLKQRLVVVSTSRDKSHKLWMLGTKSGSFFWSCHAVGLYHQRVPTSATFSRDGSLLAVSYQRSATFWDPDRNTLVAALPSPYQENLATVEFCVSRDVEYLVGLSDEYFIVWDVGTGTVVWSLRVSARSLVVDSSLGFCAVFVDAGDHASLLIVTPSSSSPLFFCERVCEGSVISAGYIRSYENGNDGGEDDDERLQRFKSGIRWLDERQQMRMMSDLSLGERLYAPEEITAKRSELGEVFDAVASEANELSIDVSSQAGVKLSMQRNGGKTLSAPPHMLPGPSFTALSFIRSFLNHEKVDAFSSQNEVEDLSIPVALDEFENAEEVDISQVDEQKDYDGDGEHWITVKQTTEN